MMKEGKMKKVLAMLLCLVMVFALVACGGGSNNGGGNGGGGSSEPAEEPEEKDTTIVVTVPAEILSLDPQVSASIPAETVKEQVFERLLSADENNNVSPMLAESWETSNDGLEWTFHLKQGVKFHDGEDFTANDVKATLDRYKTNEGSTRAYLYKYIDKVDVVDDYTVKITTSVVEANLLNVLAYGGAGIMSAKSLERTNEEIAVAPVGTGPYKFKEISEGEYVIVERFEDYWGEKPDLTEIKFLTVTEASTRVNMLETGEADFISGVTKEDIARLEGNDKFTVQYANSNRVAQIGFNTTIEPFNNVKVRQAMNYAIDKEAIVNGVLGGMGTVAESVLAQTTYGFSDAGNYYAKRDVEKAKELLAEAGYPDGFEATIYTCQGRYFKDKETVMAVAGQLADVGITLNIETYDWASYLETVRTAPEDTTVQMYFFGWESGTGEASYLFDSLFTEKNFAPTGWNTMYYTNPEFEKLNTESFSTIDDAERMKLYAEMQEIVMEDAPWIPLYVFQQVAVYRSDLGNIPLLPIEMPRFTRATVG